MPVVSERAVAGAEAAPSVEEQTISDAECREVDCAHGRHVGGLAVSIDWYCAQAAGRGQCEVAQDMPGQERGDPRAQEGVRYHAESGGPWARGARE